MNVHSSDNKLVLQDTHVSIAKVCMENDFAGADGILGLAFHQLNPCHDLSIHMQENMISPALTYPWRQLATKTPTIKEFHQFLQTQPQRDIEPYYTQLERQGVALNKFSFLAKRSSVHKGSAKATQSQLISDPLNQGCFILGGGTEQTTMYQGSFKRIRVIEDVYYNVRLLKVKVAGFDAFDVPLLKGKELRKHHSNAFIDTGASLIVLEKAVFSYVINCFEQINSNFKKLLQPFLCFDGTERGIAMNKLKLDEWPDIEFIFEAAMDSQDKQQSIFCKAKNYWQINAPQYNQATFKIISQLPGWPQQTILGLPLICDYYVIFARFENDYGDIKFAQASTSA